MESGKGLAGLCGLFMGFIGGFALAAYGAGKLKEQAYERGYDKAKDEDRIANLEAQVGEGVADEVPEKEADA